MKHEQTNSFLFLIEFILAILFFAISSAICLQVFVKADAIRRQTDMQNHADLKIQSAQACLSAKPKQEAMDLLQATQNENGFAVLYDKNWDVGANQAVYSMELIQEGHEWQITVAQIQPRKEILCQTLYIYRPSFAGEIADE